MSQIVIRQAVLADLEALVSLVDAYRQFQGQVSDLRAVKEFLLARFNHGESVLFIALEETHPVGFTQLYPSFSSVSLARTFVLNDLFVCPQARRKGIAAQLLAAAIEFATTLGAIRVSLLAATTNEQAISLYEATGWKRDEQFHMYHFALHT